MKTLSSVTRLLLLGWALMPLGLSAMASDAQQMQLDYERQAGQPALAQRGQVFFTVTHGNEWSCASCHSTQRSA